MKRRSFFAIIFAFFLPSKAKAKVQPLPWNVKLHLVENGNLKVVDFSAARLEHLDRCTYSINEIVAAREQAKKLAL